MKGTPQAHIITFWVDDEGFHYRDQGGQDAKKKHVKKSDSVGWKSKSDKNFVIQFKDKFPFAPPPRPLIGTGGKIDPLEVVLGPDPINPIECKYTVTLQSGLSDDPEIIIDPEGGQ